MTSLEEIKRLLAAATKLFPSPWARDEYINQIYCAEDRGAVVADMRGWGHLTGTLGLDPDDAVEAQKANAELIAKAPTLISELIEQVEQLQKLEVVVRQMVEAIGKGAVDSKEIVPVPGDGPPYRFHEEWAHHVRSALPPKENEDE